MSKIITPDRRIKPVNEDALMGLTEAKLRDGLIMIALAQLAESFHKHRKNNDGLELLDAMGHCCDVLYDEAQEEPFSPEALEPYLGELLELLLRYAWEAHINVAAELLKRHKDMVESVVTEEPTEETGK